MYTLYHSRKDCKLQVTKAKKFFTSDPSKFTEEVTAYNNCYYFCKTRKPLVTKAKEIKAEWLSRLEEQISKIEDIKI